MEFGYSKGLTLKSAKEKKKSSLLYDFVDNITISSVYTPACSALTNFNTLLPGGFPDSSRFSKPV